MQFYQPPSPSVGLLFERQEFANHAVQQHNHQHCSNDHQHKTPQYMANHFYGSAGDTRGVRDQHAMDELRVRLPSFSSPATYRVAHAMPVREIPFYQACEEPSSCFCSHSEYSNSAVPETRPRKKEFSRMSPSPIPEAVNLSSAAPAIAVDLALSRRESESAVRPDSVGPDDRCQFLTALETASVVPNPQTAPPIVITLKLNIDVQKWLDDRRCADAAVDRSGEAANLSTHVSLDPSTLIPNSGPIQSTFRSSSKVCDQHLCQQKDLRQSAKEGMWLPSPLDGQSQYFGERFHSPSDSLNFSLVEEHCESNKPRFPRSYSAPTPHKNEVVADTTAWVTGKSQLAHPSRTTSSAGSPSRIGSNHESLSVARLSRRCTSVGHLTQQESVAEEFPVICQELQPILVEEVTSTSCETWNTGHAAPVVWKFSQVSTPSARVDYKTLGIDTASVGPSPKVPPKRRKGRLCTRRARQCSDAAENYDSEDLGSPPHKRAEQWPEQSDSIYTMEDKNCAAVIDAKAFQDYEPHSDTSVFNVLSCTPTQRSNPGQDALGLQERIRLW